MEITIKHFEGKWPSFDIMLHGTAGAEPFLTIKGCRIVQGSNGPFISYPARKDENGKWWNHVYGGEKFNANILELAQVEQARNPAPILTVASSKDAPTYPPATEKDDIPF